MGPRPDSSEPRPVPRQEARPRYARIAAAAGAGVVTVVAILGGTGLLPTQQAAAGQPTTTQPTRTRPATARVATARTPVATPTSGTTPSTPPTGTAVATPGTTAAKPTPDQSAAPEVPARTGRGRRVVFDVSDQRVWLVDHAAGRDSVRRTYLVSGSVTHNLQPGTYAVYSRSLHAWGVDDSGSMRYMVRFAHGAKAAIGFHDIPVLRHALVQTRAELGTPRSHGCIRQWRPDARALWRFAPVGTTVVVHA
jgi:lipoprotein-anchoring transpeptidase ErfK/SrfK